MNRIGAAALGLLLAAVLTTGSAEAYWRTSGTGTGSASAASPVNAVVSSGTSAADLHPGGNGSVTFTVANSNGSPATFTRVTAATVTSTNQTACASSTVTVAPALPYTLPTPFTVSGGGTSATQRLSSLLQMSAAAGNSCQGVGFTVALTLTGSTN